MSDEHRTCLQCGYRKPLTAAFWYQHTWRAHQPNGRFQSLCKECTRANSRGKYAPKTRAPHYDFAALIQALGQ